MTQWTVTLLGDLRVRRDGRTLTRFRTQKATALFAWLCLTPGRMHHREELAEMLWPGSEPESARVNLRTALAALRRELEPDDAPPGSVIVSEGRTHVGIAADSVQTDVARFRAACAAGFNQTAASDGRSRALEDALAVYAGPLLPGFYEDWILAERAELAESFHRAVAELAAIREREGRLDEAVNVARKAVSADPLREEAHAAVIRLLMAAGQAAAARAQFASLERNLGEKLGVEPDPGIRRLLSEAPAAGTGPHPPARASVAAVSDAAPVTTIGAVPSAATPQAAPSRTGSTNLPLTLTQFFGRKREIEELDTLLMRPDIRLITITGPGGSGKTRLAIEAARRYAREAEAAGGSVWFVPLGDLRDPGRIPSEIARALGAMPSATVSPLDQIVFLFAENRLSPLLILDNFEQLAEAGSDVVQELLARAPSLRCVVTSRQSLPLGAQREFPLPPLPLPLPLPDSETGLRELAANPGVQLFVDRARSSRPGFELNQNNAAAIAAICAKLEGIPLALELAAGWAQTLTPSQMLERLDQRFSLLVSRRRDLPGRHATLHAAIDWSYALLPDEVRGFFARLSVFRGGWTLEAAEAVTGEPNTLDYLARLQEHSLVTAVEESAEAACASMRFRMLETLREFGMERLSEDEQALAALRRRHYDCFLRLAEESESRLRGPGQIEWLRRYDLEHDNLRSALSHSARFEERDAQLRLAASLWWYWLKRSHFAEGRDWIEAALKRCGDDSDTALRARALNGLGTFLYWQGDYDPSAARLEQSLALTDSRDARAEPRLAAFSLFLLSMIAVNGAAQSADPPATVAHAHGLAEASLERAERAGDPWSAARPHLPLGFVSVSAGDAPAARAHMETYLRIMREQGDLWETLPGLTSLGVLQRFLGDRDGAESTFREQTQIAHDLRNALGLALGLWGVGGALAHTAPECAAAILGAADRIADMSRTKMLGVWSPVHRADVAACRAALGEDAFAAAAARGRALDADEAVSFALRPRTK